jgi:ankyrin repeat protein
MSDLCKAAEDADLSEVARLVNSGVDINEPGGIHKETALCASAGTGHLEVADFLLAHGAHVENADCDGFTALHYCARPNYHGGPDKESVGRRNEIARHLLEHNASVNARIRHGDTPLLLAVAEDNVALVKLLLEHGADPSLADSDGVTPLRISGFATVNDPDLARLLRDHGAR